MGPSPSLGKGASGPSEGEIVVYGPSGKTVPESLDPGSFRARKGRLTFPVVGQAEVKAAIKEGGPGLEIKAALGATVRAAHAGRVAFADRYGTYGSLVILDHGDRCYTVSANLGTIDVKVGDEISSGEKIGTVGDDGRGPSLYFEVRVGNDKVPPATWLGL
jgi:septal ring factor EnvC (AmiA/AmiB activator)